MAKQKNETQTRQLFKAVFDSPEGRERRFAGRPQRRDARGNLTGRRRLRMLTEKDKTDLCRMAHPTCAEDYGLSVFVPFADLEEAEKYYGPMPVEKRIAREYRG